MLPSGGGPAGSAPRARGELGLLPEALRVARASGMPGKHPHDEAVVVLDEDQVGVLLRMIHDHAPLGVTITERNLVEEIDQVVTQTLVRSRNNADDRKRGVRRAIAAVFRRYVLKPVGETYDSTVPASKPTTWLIDEHAEAQRAGRLPAS